MDEWKTRLRQARESQGLNKTEFAKLVKVSNPTVTDWEKDVLDGGIREITGPKLMRVCEVLKIDPEWLLNGRKRIPAEVSSGGLAGSMKLTCETAKELLLLSVYRLANEDQRRLIDIAVDEVRRELDGRVQHQI
jgi:transcriptional regulator with XRE-family HTH domain